MEHNKEFLNLILDRRSCRSFRPDLPDRPTLAAIVEAGRFAPSAQNCQLTRFYVITDPKVLAGITDTVSRRMKHYAGRDCRYGAPVLILVTNSKSNSLALQDTSCAMENMMLAASALGLGSCWINHPHHLTDDPEMRALLAPIGVTEDEVICASLSLGWPADPVHPGRKEHKGNPVFWVG